VRTLVATELALAFVLVLVVGLLSKSYLELMHVDPGFAPQNVVTLSLLPDDVHYTTPTSRLAYFDAVVSRMRIVPGVQDAAYASTLPLSHGSTSSFYVREHPLPRDIDAPSLDTYLVSTNYLNVMNIPLRYGRRLSREDTSTSQAVAVISESAARAQFTGDNPIGQHIQIGRHSDGPWMTIVGVVGNVHQYGLDRTGDAAIYVPFAQVVRPSQGWASLVVRSSQPPERMESAVRAAMTAVDPLQPVFHLQPMTTFVALSVAQRTFALALVSAFGVLALLLATGGVYGVVSYVVERRTREVGIRLALGAPPSAVRWLMVREMLVVAVAAVIAGFVLASATTSGLSPLLFGVTRFDVETTLAVAGALIAAALCASWAPVARAARVDPLVALRAE
jgi:putative ABC transport system permease protein